MATLKKSKPFQPRSCKSKQRVEHVVDMNVRLALLAVAEDLEPAWVAEQPADEVVGNAVGLPRADDVGESEADALKVEHVGVRADQSLAGELARAVGRDRQQGAIGLGDRRLSGVAVDAAAGGIDQPAELPRRASPRAGSG